MLYPEELKPNFSKLPYGSNYFYLDDGAPIEAVHRYFISCCNRDVDGDPCTYFIKDEKKFQALLNRAEGLISEDERSLNDLANKKWIYPQGGSISVSTLEKGLISYYTPKGEFSFCDETKRMLDESVAHLNRVMDRRHTYSHYILNRTESRECRKLYKGDARTNSGMTGFDDRRKPEIIKRALHEAFTSPYRFDPAIAMGRHKDSKYRNIFCDSFANYFRAGRAFSRIFDCWHNCWAYDDRLGDEAMEIEIMKLSPKSCFNSDLHHMDQYFSYQHAEYAITSFAGMLGISKKETSEMLFVMRELFEQDVVLGDFIYCSDNHYLLSGEYITHDIEGMFNIIVLTAAAQSIGFTVIKKARPLRKNECFIKVKGDDSTILFGRHLTESEQAAIADAEKRIYADFAMIVNFDKTSYDENFCEYCKRKFYMNRNRSYRPRLDSNIPTSLYSVKKAINGIYHPEHFPKFKERRSWLLWFCTIMECASGSKAYKAIIKEIIDSNPEPFGLAVEEIESGASFPDEDLAFYNKDWWVRQFGEKFDIKRSQTYKLITIYLNKVSHS